MSATIWKFTVAIADTVEFAAPASFRYLHAACDSPGLMNIWAEVDPSKAGGWPTRRFFIRGTGHPLPPGATYLATCLAPPFVWHLFGPSDD